MTDYGLRINYVYHKIGELTGSRPKTEKYQTIKWGCARIRQSVRNISRFTNFIRNARKIYCK